MKVRGLVKLVAAVAVATVLSGGNAFAFFWGHSSGIFGGNFGNQNQSVPFLGRLSGRLKGKTDIQELTKEASAGRLKVAVQKNNDGSGDYCGFYGTGRDGFTPTIRIVPCNGDKKIGSNWFCPIGKTMVAIAQADTWGHDGKNHHVAFTCVDTPPGVQDPTPDGRRIILNWHGWKIAYGPKDAWTGVSPQYATANSVKQDIQGLTSRINSINQELYALAGKVNTNTNNIVYNRERINELQNQVDNLNVGGASATAGTVVGIWDGDNHSPDNFTPTVPGYRAIIGNWKYGLYNKLISLNPENANIISPVMKNDDNRAIAIVDPEGKLVFFEGICRKGAGVNRIPNASWGWVLSFSECTVSGYKLIRFETSLYDSIPTMPRVITNEGIIQYVIIKTK